jgi:hypothetical protein
MASNAGAAWSQTDLVILDRMWQDGLSKESIAKMLGRTTSAIKVRLEVLGYYAASGTILDSEKEPRQFTAQYNQPIKKKPMNTTVTTKTYIGSRLASDHSIEEVLDIIDRENNLLDRLTKLSTTDNIQRLIDKHSVNIQKLEEVLGDMV